MEGGYRIRVVGTTNHISSLAFNPIQNIVGSLAFNSTGNLAVSYMHQGKVVIADPTDGSETLLAAGLQDGLNGLTYTSTNEPVISASTLVYQVGPVTASPSPSPVATPMQISASPSPTPLAGPAIIKITASTSNTTPLYQLEVKYEFKGTTCPTKINVTIGTWHRVHNACKAGSIIPGNTTMLWKVLTTIN